MQLTSEIPKDPDQKREWIKYQLCIRGITLAALGRQHGSTRQAISTALRRPAPRWEYVIADALGLKPAQVWPERYNENALPKRENNKCQEHALGALS